ncbi:protein PHLOEM PROTEIN 2-LIKE A1-like [Miscanthus floridulus]|uniref:protein PHLOEM PROTEIN 2-LIKE A1-like n=1 Tax=Miscanthus floridulus TaxID=154761 RepID=UPI00345A9190
MTQIATMAARCWGSICLGHHHGGAGWGDAQHPPRDSEVEAASLQNVCWLEVHGKLELSHLTPGVTYDVVLQVMLTEPAYGWSVPVNLRLRFPDGTVQERKEKLQERPTKQWLELKAGEVKAQQGGGGLLIKGVKIVPKE